MLGSYSRLLEQSKLIHNAAKEGYWWNIFTRLASNPALGYYPDPNPQTADWSLADHAVYQRRMDVLLKLRQEFKCLQSPQPCVILHLAFNQHWPFIINLLHQGILSANVIYTLPKGERVTLLDLAASNRLTQVVKCLRYEFAGKTTQELDVVEMTKHMFIAAKNQQWPAVFKMIACGAVDIDFVDRSTEHNATLLHYAYEQRNQTVFLKLLDKYHASLDEIRNEDKDLYESLLGFYDQCIHDRGLREEEQLIEHFNQALSHLSAEAEQPEDRMSPISQAFTFSPSLTSTRSVMSETEVVGIRALNPENDEIIVRKVERRVPWC